jgi:EmrB/QacA subfamily drug resistance transporter
MNCPPESRPWILAATVLGSSLAFIDGTVVNVALPALQAQMNATITDVQWVVEAYALFLSALLLTGGALGDRYGRRRIYAAGVALFALASIGCALSSTINMLIFTRAVQGVGAALLVPGSLAIISASFGEEERGKAIGLWSGFTAITTAIGPLLGGSLIEHVSWRAIFYLNIPIAAIVLFLVFRHVPESRDEQGAGRPDIKGALLASLGLGAIVFGLIESATRGLANPLIASSLVSGCALLGLFFFVEAHTAGPMLPLALFRSRSFSGANLLTLLLYAALGGAMFFFPLNLIQLQGYSATAAGAALLPMILIMFVLSRWSGGLVAKMGAKLPLVAGPVIAAAGFALFMFPGVGGSYWVTFFPAVVVLGAGMAISIAPLTTTVMNSVGRGHSGIASGINNAVARAAGLLAIAVLGLVMSHSFNSTFDRRLAGAQIPADSAREMDSQRAKLGGMTIPATADTATAAKLKSIIGDSFVAGFRTVMFVASILALLAAASAWLTFRDAKWISPQAGGPG